MSESNDISLLKKYILGCPDVNKNSHAMAAALSSLDEANTNESDPRDTLASTPLPTTKKRGYSGVLTLLRVLLLDSPILIILSVCMFFSWVHHVHDNYLVKQLEAVEWTEERATETDLTYYARPCFKEDMSTFDAQDLFLSEDATPQDAYNHQLRHGFTVFPRVLSDETARDVRNYIDLRNRNLTEAETNFVIAGNNRYSFNPGVEVPAVARAVEEVTNNKLLQESVEKIMGRNPALIELTAITASYGAEAQRWHDDVVPFASPVQYARAFGPSYTIFIMLQNTTKSMGATAACPGLYMCADGPRARVCGENGVQLVNENGYWRAGDALLMNMNSWHRGAAHTDPNAPDRVMLILTWVPKPRSRAESRQLAQGITFSLRWDMWGHTWNDLRNVATTMKQPWTMLRALGLYKKQSTDWGIDYVTSVSMRYANEDNGFRNHELIKFVHRDGGFKFLPSWLHGHVGENEETSWHEFLLETLSLCEKFVTTICKYLISGYVSFYLLTSLLLMILHGNVQKGIRRFCQAILRVAAMVGIVFAFYKAGIRHVDNTQWALDLRHGLRYTSPFGNNEESRYYGPTVFPHRNDVLIESRFKSEYLALYNDYISNHPGNRVWNELLDEKVVTYASYSGLPSRFRDAVAGYIVLALYETTGRFLYQDPDSDFVEISGMEAVFETKRELMRKSNPIRAKILSQLDYLISEAKYGHLRTSVMSKGFTLPYLADFQLQLMSSSDPLPKVSKKVSIARPRSRTETPSRSIYRHSESVVLPKTLRTKSIQPRRAVTLHVGRLSPSPYAHLQSGKIVEVSIGERGNVYWHMAEIEHVSSTGDILVYLLDTEEELYTYHRDVRPYGAPVSGEIVEISDGSDYQKGTILVNQGNGLFDVAVNGDIWENEEASSFRRARVD